MTTYFSQYGQDEYLDQHQFHEKEGGVFLDVGAHDGISHSNTVFFEKYRNWTGLCVEPLPSRFDELKANRSCVVVHGCIGAESGSKTLVALSGVEDMLSYIEETVHVEHIRRIEREAGFAAQDRATVRSYRIDELLSSHKITSVDYCSIDAEGSEREVLRSIDFNAVDFRVFSIENNYRDRWIEWFMLLKGYRRETVLGVDEIYVKRPARIPLVLNRAPALAVKHLLQALYRPIWRTFIEKN